MNVYEYAMKVEKEGEAYYREMANAASNPGLKKIFTMLADEEVKHYNVFRNMMKKEDIDFENLDLITDTKTIFTTLAEEKDNVNFDSEQIQFYKDAIVREEKSHDFYAEKAQELEGQEKKIFLHIAEEETKHKKVLEEIVIFLEEPADWVASAEF